MRPVATYLGWSQLPMETTTRTISNRYRGGRGPLTAAGSGPDRRTAGLPRDGTRSPVRRPRRGMRLRGGRPREPGECLRSPPAVVGEVPRLLGVGLGAGRPDLWLSPITRPYWDTDSWSRGSYRRRRIPSVPRVYRRATPIPRSCHTKPMCSYIDPDPCPPRYPWLRRLVSVW